MSVTRVTLTASGEQYAPPYHEIEIAVIGNEVFITVYDGSADDLKDGRTKAYEVPQLALSDLLAALNAFSDAGAGIRFARPEIPAGGAS